MSRDSHTARGVIDDPEHPEPTPPATLPESARPGAPAATRPAFRLFVTAVTVLAVACTALLGTATPNDLAPWWFLALVAAVYVYAVALASPAHHIVRAHVSDVPDLAMVLTLLALAPFPLAAATTVCVGVLLSVRVGASAWLVAFTTANAVLAAAAGGLVLHLAPSTLVGPTAAGVVLLLLAGAAREAVAVLSADLGCRVGGIGERVDFGRRRTLVRYASYLSGIVVAVATVALVHLPSPLGPALALALLVTDVLTSQFLTREANRRWLAEAVAASGERIRAASTLDDVLSRLATEVAALWHSVQWRVRPQAAHVQAPLPGEHVTTVPLLRGHEIALSHPASFSRSDSMLEATESLVRMAVERERVLRFQRRLELQASRDDLTGLGNRTRLWEMLDTALPEASTNNRVAAVYVDVDRFKSVNDTYGHMVGDSLLRMVAERLTQYAGRIETPTRLSGDEFVIVITHAPDDATLLSWVEGLRAHLTEPYDLDGSFVDVTFSIGIAVASEPADRSDILGATDAAVARAKKSGRGSVVLATEEVIDASRRRQQLEESLRTALATPEFELHYQPIVNTETGRVTSVEALIRWFRDGRIWMRPDEFIQYAEEIGLITPIGLWVLRRACTQMKAWNEQHRPDEPLSVSINVSTVHIAQPTFVADVARILDETGFPPELLIIEITETFALLDLEKSVALGAELKAMGVRLWLDDFGTGYSSLEYVRQLPVEVVKLDRSFIVDLGSDATTRTFIEALVGLCRSIERQPMAEGVERPEQRALLAELGCVVQQGYHFARPMPVEELADYVLRADDSVRPRRTA